MAKKKSPKKHSSKGKDLFKPRRIKVKIIGLGGGASSIISEMAGFLKGPSFVIADTDQRSFKKLKPNIRPLQFGQEITRGWGTGMNPSIGQKAAQAAKEKIAKIFHDIDLVCLISCLGGGVGSGAGLVFAELLKESKKTSIGIFTLPFSFEGEKKMRLAKNCLKELRKDLSGTIVLPNEEILKLSDKKASLKKSLSLVNQVLIDYLADLVEIISSPGLINIDFADLRTILKGRGQALCFGQGIGQGITRTADALKEVFRSPFFESFSKTGSKNICLDKILFNVSAGDDLGLKEVEEIAEAIYHLNTKAKIIFGISQNSKLKKKIKITFLGVGRDFFKDDQIDFEKPESVEKKNEKNNKPVKTEPEQKQLKKPKKKKPAKKKKQLVKPRRNALEIKKDREKQDQEEWIKEPEWEIPAFLRKKIK